MTTSTPRTNSATPRLNKAFTTATLIAAAGSLGLVGCSSSNTDRYSQDINGLGQHNSQVTSTRSYFNNQANKTQLPEQYRTEARIGMTEVEAQLAEAQAIEIEAQSIFDEQVARINAFRHQANSEHRIATTQAEQIREQYRAQRDALIAKVNATQSEAENATVKDAAIFEALAKEKQTLHDDLLSLANQEFASANARLDQLRLIRGTTEEEGRASIDEMIEATKATRARAAATVNALRSEADTVATQTEARADELTVTIDTVRSQTNAESDRLASESQNLLKQAEATTRDLYARADALTEQASQEQYDIKVTAAETTWEGAQTESRKQFDEAKNTFERTNAQLDGQRAEVQRIVAEADNAFESGIKSLDAWFEDAMAEVDKIRVSSDLKEESARVAFIKAEAQAQADAIRETAAHQEELAEETRKTITAEAEAEAAAVREQIIAQLAAKQAAGSTEFDGKTEPVEEISAETHAVPEVADVEPVTPQIEPERIAEYRASLAEVMRDREVADAQAMAIKATFDETKSNFEATKREQYAVAAALESTTTKQQVQANAALANAEAVIKSDLQTAEATFNRTLVEADTFRREALAEAADLRATAKANFEIAQAKSQQIAHEAQAVSAQGASEVRALEAELRGVRQRGHAQEAQLLAEADSVQRSQQAWAEQLEAQIAAADQTLTAELAKLDRSLISQDAIAQANYQEALVQADVIARKSDVELARFNANSELQRRLAEAEIDRTRNQIYIARIMGEADVEKRLAQATFAAQNALAQAEADKSQAQSIVEVAQAELFAKQAAALAKQDSVKALFDARLVQIDAERTREVTDQFRQDWFQRTTLEAAMAKAEAARETSFNRFAELEAQQVELGHAAATNWDVRLAGLRKFDHTPNTTLVNGPLPRPEAEGETIQVSDVPVSND